MKLLTSKREEAHRGYIFASLFWEYRHFFYSDCYFGFQVFIISNLSPYSSQYFLYSCQGLNQETAEDGSTKNFACEQWKSV